VDATPSLWIVGTQIAHTVPPLLGILVAVYPVPTASNRSSSAPVLGTANRMILLKRFHNYFELRLVVASILDPSLISDHCTPLQIRLVLTIYTALMNLSATHAQVILNGRQEFLLTQHKATSSSFYHLPQRNGRGLLVSEANIQFNFVVLLVDRSERGVNFPTVVQFCGDLVAYSVLLSVFFGCLLH
jgi:hypothetical protein